MLDMPRPKKGCEHDIRMRSSLIKVILFFKRNNLCIVSATQKLVYCRCYGVLLLEFINIYSVFM